MWFTNVKSICKRFKKKKGKKEAGGRKSSCEVCCPPPFWTHRGYQRDSHPPETRPDHEDATAAFRETPPALLTAPKLTHESINPAFFLFLFCFHFSLPFAYLFSSSFSACFPVSSQVGECSSCFSWGWSGSSKLPCGESNARRLAPSRRLPRSRVWHLWGSRRT